MWNRVHLITVHDRGTDTYRTRTFTDLDLLKMTVRTFFKDLLRPVIRHIDKCRLTLHQAIQVIKEMLNAFSLHGRKYLKRDQGTFRFGDMVGHFHSIIIYVLYGLMKLIRHRIFIQLRDSNEYFTMNVSWRGHF